MALMEGSAVPLVGFNEAGAINAGKLSGPESRLDLARPVSMRPAQLTPENGRRRQPPRRQCCRFNEAGAINAENPPARNIRERNRTSFNEAGAINAGKPQHHIHIPAFSVVVSMRPAQLTPGKRATRRTPTDTCTIRFNEAGAINAGKRPSSCFPTCAAATVSMRPAQLTPENIPRRCSAISSRKACFNEAGAINAGKPTFVRHILPPHLRFQ